MATTTDTVRGVGTITLRRAAKRNALDARMLSELLAAVRSVEADASVRAVVVRASEDARAFSAGHDLAELAASTSTEDEARKLFELCAHVTTELEGMRKPTIAAVHGPCAAVGLQMALSTDLLVCSPSSSFNAPGVNLGLFCHSPAVALRRAVGDRRAMEMLLTGRVVRADEAERIGIASRVTKVDSWEAVDAEAHALAATLAAKSAPALAMGKRVFRETTGVAHADVRACYARVADAMTHNLVHVADASEGIHAFLEKRKPVWRHQ